MSATTLTNGNFTVEFQRHSRCTALFERFRRFFHPFFYEAENSDLKDLTLVFQPPEAFEPAWIARCRETIEIRKSSAARFNLVAAQYTTGEGERRVWDAERRVGYWFRPAERFVAFYGEMEAFVHLIELIRYYGLLVEQSKGTVVLHGAAVLADRERAAVWAICGGKGKGKTTAMLRKVLGEGLPFFSGDKLLITLAGNGLLVRGWPDYPHVGIGSLREFPEFAARIGVPLMDGARAPRDLSEKALVDPSEYYCHLSVTPIPGGFLEKIILPDVRAKSALFRQLDRDEKTGSLVESFIEYPHEFKTAQWHGMIPPGLNACKGIPEAVLARLQAVPWEMHHTPASKSGGWEVRP